ncbi:MAG: alanine racemase [Hominenteromicrobium sp.]
MNILQKRTWAEIDLDAAAHNLAVIRRRIGENRLLCCVIKADAYGHGAVRLAKEYEVLGADWLALSNIEEALQLRRAGVSLPMLVLGYTPPEAARTLAENNISQCAYSAEYCAALSENAAASGVSVKIHIKADTGMSRLGFYFQDAARDAAAVTEIAAACRLPGLIPEGIFTHFAVADGGADGEAYTKKQLACFTALIDALAAQGVAFPIRHCANSGAALDYPESYLDMVRAGVILYGLEPSAEVAQHDDFRPVLSLRSVIAHVKEIDPGTDVSYGRTYTAQSRVRIATVPIGYADGYSRQLSNRGFMLVHGVRCPILGKVCMDQCMIDVTAVPEAGIGDTVTVIGCDGGERITADELAALLDTIHYEVVCGISKRVTRVYIKDGKEDSVFDCILD